MLTADIDQLGVFDTETTGTDYENDRIVTAYIGVMAKDGTLTKTYSWLINPGVEIPDGAFQVHGISNELAQREGADPKVAIKEIAVTLARLVLAGVPLCAYNGRFDFTLLDRELRRYYGRSFMSILKAELHIIDPYVVDKQLDKWRRGKRKLVFTAEHYGVPLGDDAHDAAADAIATGRVALAVVGLPGAPKTVEDLHVAQIAWAQEQAEDLQAYFRSPKGGSKKGIVIEGEWPIVTYVEPLAPELEDDLAAAI